MIAIQKTVHPASFGCAARIKIDRRVIVDDGLGNPYLVIVNPGGNKSTATAYAFCVNVNIILIDAFLGQRSL